MVVRRRGRAVLLPLALYSASALVVGYFVHHAHHGSRGLEAKRQLKIQGWEIMRELDQTRAERAVWERRIALLRSDQIDRDLLEERGRVVLGRVHPSDLVIVTAP